MPPYREFHLSGEALGDVADTIRRLKERQARGVPVAILLAELHDMLDDLAITLLQPSTSSQSSTGDVTGSSKASLKTFVVTRLLMADCLIFHFPRRASMQDLPEEVLLAARTSLDDMNIRKVVVLAHHLNLQFNISEAGSSKASLKTFVVTRLLMADCLIFHFPRRASMQDLPEEVLLAARTSLDDMNIRKVVVLAHHLNLQFNISEDPAILRARAAAETRLHFSNVPALATASCPIVGPVLLLRFYSNPLRNNCLIIFIN
ncbi:uncharacterized protein LOC132198840 [Neocloeon triangulifer]|uniref:uncharacterized protein LOC132198840 n=1 Tax=Neocloeon triangulifer TaxID=2078957 RepID=UPI00286F7643|nr:uncharacterized protein LOC132198840 [Neocloeon triangulifer]